MTTRTLVNPKADSTTWLIQQYTDQAPRMPNAVRNRIESEWKGEAVQLYGMADLDPSLRLCCQWVALGPRHVAVVEQNGPEGVSVIRSFERSRIKEVAETHDLSCTTLMLLSGREDPALAILHYTHRQRKVMDNIIFILQQQLEGQDTPVSDADKVYAEAVAQPIRKAQASVTVHRLTVVWRLLGYLKPYRRRFLVGTVGAAMLTVVSLLPPYLTGVLIDRAIRPAQSGQLGIQEAAKVAWLVVLAMAVVYGLRELFVWIRLRSMSVLGEFVARDLRTQLYEHLQTLSLNYFSSKQTGSIITRVSADTDRLWHFLALGVVDASLGLITLVGLGAVLLVLDWRLGLVMTLPMPVIMWVLLTRSRRMQKLFLAAWRKWSNLTAVLGDTIPGMRVVKAFHREAYEKDRFNDHNDRATREFNRIHVVWTRFWPLIMMVLHLMMILVWVLAIPRLLGRGSPLSIGQFISFLLYMGMFMWPVEMLGQTVQMMNRATSSANRIFEVLDTEPQVLDIDNSIRLSPVCGRVEFENVTFAYDGVRPVIRGVSFVVEAGEMIGLVGPSGAGKTTVINLIARFYDVTKGRILIDGADLRNLDTGHYRRQIGMVLQDPYLFHGTILDNIRYGKLEAGKDEIIEAARAANAHDFICRLPNGYDTVIGERGHTLSGGERQRMSIARAILNNPRILILDEATSSVDTETERKIQQALNRLIAGRTVFAIAHRLSTLSKANRLLVIEDGKITEQGTHAELLSHADGTYSKLCRMQQELHGMYAV